MVKLKLLIKLVIKSVCFVILVIHGLSITSHYLSYPYVYKITIADNKNGFDLPPISVCTEPNVFFDTHKVMNYLDSIRITDILSKALRNIPVNCLSELVQNQMKINGQCFYLEKNYYYLRGYYRNIFVKAQNLLSNSSYHELKALIIGFDTFFDCKFNVHYR